jgi:hypothetical protein
MLQFGCRKCGFRGPTLEGHQCVTAASVPERVERARAVLTEASERMGVEYRPPRDLPMPKHEFQAPAQSSGGVQAKEGRGFDRNAYHKAYMKGYMRVWRARRKAI